MGRKSHGYVLVNVLIFRMEALNLMAMKPGGVSAKKASCNGFVPVSWLE